MEIWIRPAKKAKNNTSSTLLTVVPDLVPGIVPTLEATTSERMAVGPTLMSREVPKMAYMKRQMKLVYSPYCNYEKDQGEDHAGNTMMLERWCDC